MKRHRDGCVRGAAPLAVMLASVVGMIVLAAPASAVIIDGYDSDWTTWDSLNDDPNEADIYDAFDIDVNLFVYGRSDDTYYFYWRTYDPYLSITGDYSYILIDADSNSATGGTVAGVDGIEYYLSWDLGDGSLRRTTGSATLYVWNSGSGSWQAGSSYPVARGDDPTGSAYSFVEWSVPRSAIGANSFLWAAYYDNAVTVPDDYCPDTVSERGFVPEPGSALLLLVGVGALGWFRRRQS